MKKILILTLLILSALCLFSCSCSGFDKFDEDYVYDGHSLIGKWQEEDYDTSFYFTYEFFENGKFEQRQYRYGIEVTKSAGTYTAEGNKFVVEFKNYDGTSSFVENKFCITEDGELVMVYLDEQNQMEEKEMVLVPFNITHSETNSTLLGAWEDSSRPGEIWTFNSDFTGTIFGGGYTYKFYYSVHDDMLYIATELIEGSLDSLVGYEFEIDGSVLTIEAEINDTAVKLSFNKR